MDIDFSALARDLASFYSEYPYAPWLATLPELCANNYNAKRYGDLPSWQATLAKVRQLQLAKGADDFGQPAPILGGDTLDPATRSELKQLLLQLAPWRKGPFAARGLLLDAEWRCDQKWARLGNLQLSGRRILDVGCGNGYYALRMLGAGAAHVLGIDPSPRFIVQFASLKALMAGDCHAQILPLGIEQLPAQMPWFDMVFSMGVFYHRRAPLEHLLELKGKLRQGGQLLLETLVVDGAADTVLMPKARYAMMRNVWFIPSVAALSLWLARVGFSDIQVIDVSSTSTAEQRRTEFMQFQSLSDFLDPTDSSKTIEGYSAPKRAMLLATNG